MARKKTREEPAPTKTRSNNISIKVPEELFGRIHQYRYRPESRTSLKALTIAALDEYLKERGA